MADRKWATRKRPARRLGRRRRNALLALASVAARAVAAGPSSPQQDELSGQRQLQQEHAQRHDERRTPPRLRKNSRIGKRSLASASYCGNGWQDAHDSCDTPCTLGNDEECGPGRYCYGYVDCTPPDNGGGDGGGFNGGGGNPEGGNPGGGNPEGGNPEGGNPEGGVGGGGGNGVNPWENQYPGSNNNNNNQAGAAMMASEPYSAPAPSPQVISTTRSPNYMPAYIASLPVRPSEPTTPAPFVLPKPTPNTKSNPSKNYCGYGWESAMTECFHACPSGKDDECPGGKTCHTWLTCTPSTTDPATLNVCGKNWAHAAATCATRCFLGGDDTCPPGETCFGGVTECETKLPALTAEDVGLVEKTYTPEEIAVLLNEEIARERDEAFMSDPKNWWCGTSWSNMVENCSKRCTSDEDCKPDAWTAGFCYKTTGGPDNCSQPGVPVKAASPPGSKWCGSSWNDMLETCDKKCEEDEDCGDGRKCWEAPDTCMWVGVPVKEKSDSATLWCGVDYDDAQTSCHKACPGEGDDECPEGMSCFSGSSCTAEGEPIVREGYRCGTSWEEAAKECGMECQKKSDCEPDEECFAEVVCDNELQENEDGMVAGMFCGATWESTAQNCAKRCETDEDCDQMEWCYWVECENLSVNMEEPMTEPTKASCSAEVRQCPNGQYVGRAVQLDCDFYPCPEGGEEEGEVAGEKVDATEEMSAPFAATEADLSAWGSAPLVHACSSGSADGCGLCEGDCNSDDDCRDGLMCFSRGQGEKTSVPGCVSGGDGDKPGMDYCYSPFPPETTTTTTTTTSTTTTTISTTTTTAKRMDLMSADYTVKSLEYARECSGTNPCGACEGDCDNESHCADGLKCFSRGVGSVELVPGCLGLGVAGMDYCYDPNMAIVLPPTGSPTRGGCSAEVRTCPNGVIVRQDPANNCKFSPCETNANGAAAVASKPKLPPTEPPSRASPGSSSPTFDASTFYCGYSLAHVNSNCATAKPCPLGLDTECSGLEVCIRDTDCNEYTQTSTTASNVATDSSSATTAPTTELELCDSLCVEKLPSEWCPEQTSELNLPNCLEVGLGELCEADGECGTDEALNNCGTYDIYARVVCGTLTQNQGDIMRGTVGPTGSPTHMPTAAPSTAKPTAAHIVTPVPTNNTAVAYDASAEAAATNNTPLAAGNASSSAADNTVSISIADAVATASANTDLATSGSQGSLLQGPTSPPIKEYESHAAAATLTYDRNPGSGVSYDRNPGGEHSLPTSSTTATAADEQQQPVVAVGSSEWYNSVYVNDPSSDSDVNSGGWNLDSYFRSPTPRSSTNRIKRMKLSCALPVLILMGAFMCCVA